LTNEKKEWIITVVAAFLLLEYELPLVFDIVIPLAYGSFCRDRFTTEPKKPTIDKV
jgi:hypothetical protein